MDNKHHCNGCPHWYVTHKKYPSGFYNITICGKYNKQLYYMEGEENQTPHPCNICAEQFSYIPYIEQILDGVEQVTERLSANCPCNKCGKDKKCVLAKEACEDFLKWEDNCIKKLAEYETAEEEGRLVVLPCKVGDKVYQIISRYTECTPYGDTFDESSCCGCEEECDSHKEYEIIETKAYTLEDIAWNIRCENWGRNIFTDREEAEKVLEEMKKNNATD